MLWMGLRRERVPGRNTDLMTTCRAAIDAGERSGDARGMHSIERCILRLGQALTVFIESHWN